MSKNNSLGHKTWQEDSNVAEQGKDTLILIRGKKPENKGGSIFPEDSWREVFSEMATKRRESQWSSKDSTDMQQLVGHRKRFQWLMVGAEAVFPEQGKRSLQKPVFC